MAFGRLAKGIAVAEQRLRPSPERIGVSGKSFRISVWRVLKRRLEVFRAAATDALELAERDVLPGKRRSEPDLEDVDLGSVSRPKLGRMVTLILESREPDERFGAIELSREVNERFRDRMRRAVDPAQMSVVLRRLHRRGRIHLVRAGRPYKEALYVRERPPAEDRS
jgi:hypothetical protein